MNTCFHGNQASKLIDKYILEKNNCNGVREMEENMAMLKNEIFFISEKSIYNLGKLFTHSQTKSCDMEKPTLLSHP